MRLLPNYSGQLFNILRQFSILAPETTTLLCLATASAFVVVILCGSDDFVRRFMLAAHRNQMTSGDYVFISLGLLPPDNVQQPWLRHHRRRRCRCRTS